MALTWSGFTHTFFFPVVGLDAAGKTTILYKLKLGEIVTTIPTIGKRYHQKLYFRVCFLSVPMRHMSHKLRFVNYYY